MTFLSKTSLAVHQFGNPTRAELVRANDLSCWIRQKQTHRRWLCSRFATAATPLKSLTLWSCITLGDVVEVIPMQARLRSSSPKMKLLELQSRDQRDDGRLGFYFVLL